MKQISPEKVFRPYSCVFVISVDKNGKPSGMIAGWNTKCGYNPPLFAVVLSKKGYTHKLIQQSKEFVIAVPNKGLEKAVGFFGTTHGNEVDKFKRTGIKTLKAKYVKSPLLKDATINLECKLYKEINVGDNIMFIGKILAAYINPNKKILMVYKKVNGKRIYKEF
jgi:flavin reductase (DIM6/NTAB) family NADH-FMN oxidoreductase RutF